MRVSFSDRVTAKSNTPNMSEIVPIIDGIIKKISDGIFTIAKKDNLYF